MGTAKTLIPMDGFGKCEGGHNFLDFLRSY